MSELSVLQDRLAKLRKARASGVLEIRHGETSTRYKSDSEMAAAEAALVGQINAVAGTARGPKYIHQTGKGL